MGSDVRVFCLLGGVRVGWSSMLIWSLKLDYEFMFVIPGIPLVERFRFVLLKYLYFIRDRFLASRGLREAHVFGMQYRYNDRFGLGSLQRVYCSSWRLRRLLPEKPIVVDVGANLGQFNFFCRHYLGATRVLSIEPIPTCFSALELNSGVSADCINAAIAPIFGKVILHVATDSQLSSVVPDESVGYGDSITVDSYPLDSLLDQRAIEKIDLLKIDTEGNEMDVLRSAERSLGRCGAVLVEMSVFRKSTGNLFAVGNFLEDKGFCLQDLIFSCTRSPRDVDGVFIRS